MNEERSCIWVGPWVTFAVHFTVYTLIRDNQEARLSHPILEAEPREILADVSVHRSMTGVYRALTLPFLQGLARLLRFVYTLLLGLRPQLFLVLSPLAFAYSRGIDQSLTLCVCWK